MWWIQYTETLALSALCNYFFYMTLNDFQSSYLSGWIWLHRYLSNWTTENCSSFCSVIRQFSWVANIAAKKEVVHLNFQHTNNITPGSHLSWLAEFKYFQGYCYIPYRVGTQNMLFTNVIFQRTNFFLVSKYLHEWLWIPSDIRSLNLSAPVPALPAIFFWPCEKSASAIYV